MSAELEFAGVNELSGARREVGSEIRAVGEIIHALDVTIQESSAEPESGEALASVKHGTEFLEDHLRRLYRLEESSGLLEIIVSVHPEFAHEVERLQAEHDAIRAAAHTLVQALENPTQPSDEALHALFAQLRQLIAGILRHERHEGVVLVESMDRDSGGEG